MSGIIKADPESTKRLNDLVRDVAEEIINNIKTQHEQYFDEDSEMRTEPIAISCNAYNLTMNFVNALNKQVIGMCLDMQKKKIESEQNES